MDEAVQIHYLNLAKNPDAYKNKKVVFTGKVIQIIEHGNNITFKVNVDKSIDGVWKNAIVVNYRNANKKSHLLENEMISFWGTVKGLKTYQSSGKQVTIPEVYAKYITIMWNEK